MSESLTRNLDKYGAINEKTIPFLITDIDKYVDDLKTIFSKIDSNIYELGDFYKSSSYDTLVNQYNEFRKNYEIIINNVKSYSQDINALLINFKAISKRAASELNTEADNSIKYLKSQMKEDFRNG